MKIKTVILTTDTTHHRFFAKKLGEHVEISHIVCESRILKPNFETYHPFEDRQAEYEKQNLLMGDECPFDGVASTSVYESVNLAESVRKIKELSPDVIFVFGTGKLSKKIIEIPGLCCLNLHGGHPEHYRGLDTHLWAIYHGDFRSLITTLHHVDVELDTGNIAIQKALPLTPGMKLYQLRTVNAMACVELCVAAMGALRDIGKIPSREQMMIGRYYSFMPASLKSVCEKRFENFTGSL